MAQDNLLKILQLFKDKLCCIAASETGESGFHPLAPQIRFDWVLRDFTPPKNKEVVKEKKKAVKTLNPKVSEEIQPVEAVNPHETIPENS